VTQRGPLVAAVLASLACGAMPLAGQGIPRDEYLRYVPLEYPRLTRQTPASAELHLFGDRSLPAYRDVDPVDGIDDRRGRVLQELSQRFAPFLVQNTFSIPMDVKKLMRRESAFPLTIDTWELAGGGALVASEEIDMNRLGRASCPGDTVASPPTDPASADCRLVALLDEFDPVDPTEPRATVRPVDVGSDRFRVLFFDMPGYDPASWKGIYVNPTTKRLAAEFHESVKIYAHPFLEARRDAAGDVLGYELLIQYWFYYPLNDGGNKHEGDWEHINVVISPRDRVDRLLTADEVQRILDGGFFSTTPRPDDLVLKRVEVYFHHQLMSLDYGRPNAYARYDEWEREMERLPREQIGVREVWKRTRWLAWQDDDERVVNTHPVMYIGADNKGIDQLIVPPGGRNQDSHGTFPFPGLYKTIGPAGSAEQIRSYFDHREWYASDPADRIDPERRYGRGSTELFDDAARVELVPDWERVLPLVRTDPVARREWAWLVLPVHWGYPATRSPLAGIVDHADTGNVGPIGPAFNDGWNRSGPGRGFSLYEPHVLPPFYPTDPQDEFSNSLGYFNAFSLFLSLPPFDFLWRVVASPFRAAFGRQDPVFYPGSQVPSRFIGVSAGVSHVSVPEEIGSAVLHLTDDNAVDIGGMVFPAAVWQIAADIALLDPEAGGIGPTQWIHEGSWAWFAQFTMFLGERWASSTGISHSSHAVGFREPLSTGEEPYRFDAGLSWWDISADVRYALLTSGFKPYLKLGYGVNWFRLHDMASQGVPLAEPDGPWIKNLWPPTWQYGFGAELTLFEAFGRVPHGLDMSVRAEWTWKSSPSGVNLPGSITLATFRDAPSRWTRGIVNLGLTVSF